jgi:hypothetical protein
VVLLKWGAAFFRQIIITFFLKFEKKKEKKKGKKRKGDWVLYVLADDGSTAHPGGDRRAVGEHNALEIQEILHAPTAQKKSSLFFFFFVSDFSKAKDGRSPFAR